MYTIESPRAKCPGRDPGEIQIQQNYGKLWKDKLQEQDIKVNNAVYNLTDRKYLFIVKKKVCLNVVFQFSLQ